VALLQEDDGRVPAPGRRGGSRLRFPLHERRLAAELAPADGVIGPELDLGGPDQSPSALGRRVSDDLLELAHQRALDLLKPLGVLRREREHEMVRCPYPLDPHALACVHLTEDALGELHGLKPASERGREEPLDHVPQTSLEVTKDRHGVVVFPQVDAIGPIIAA
jgi:hypothetical protein